MKLKKVFAIIVTVCTLVTSVFANEPALALDEQSVKLNTTKSIDSTFDLDFGESSNWYIDFDNEAGLFRFNHKYVDVYYDGFANSDSSTTRPAVTVRLKKEVDGVYEDVETKTAYPGNTYTFTLPNGGTLTNYRLYFTCKKDTVCTFNVTSRN